MQKTYTLGKKLYAAKVHVVVRADTTHLFDALVEIECHRPAGGCAVFILNHRCGVVQWPWILHSVGGVEVALSLDVDLLNDHSDGKCSTFSLKESEAIFRNFSGRVLTWLNNGWGCEGSEGEGDSNV